MRKPVKTFIVALVAFVFLYGIPAHAQEIDQHFFSLGLLGNDDSLEARLGWQPAERTEIGLFGLWEDLDNAVGVGVYATYDVIQSEFNIFGLTKVPATVYVGASVGAVDLPEADAVARLETGLLFGDERVQIGPVYQYALDDSLWSDLGSPPDQHTLLIALKVNF